MYKVIESYSISGLETKVSELIGQGWVCTGGLVVLKGGRGCLKYLQTMTFEETVEHTYPLYQYTRGEIDES